MGDFMKIIRLSAFLSVLSIFAVLAECDIDSAYEDCLAFCEIDPYEPMTYEMEDCVRSACKIILNDFKNYLSKLKK